MSQISQQISGRNPRGKYILSVIAKRTYKILENGACQLHEKQDSLIDNLIMDEEIEGLFKHDIDLYPFKPFTDIVLKGVARNVKKVHSFSACIEIGNNRMDYSIFADRNVLKSGKGEFHFSSEKTIREVPLNYTNAYGGKDLLAEKPIRELLAEQPSLKYAEEVMDILAGSPYRYPRNPLGKGYIINTSDENIDALILPNIENPKQLLTPQNFICKDVLKWYKMPVPFCPDWMSPGNFPRVAYFGNYTIPVTMDESVYEIAYKFASKAILKSNPDPKIVAVDFRACNGASLGLQSQHLKGGQQCRLTNIHPKKSEFIFTIPKDIPQIKIDGREGKLHTTDPVLHTILIEPEDNKLTLVWRGSGKALRPYAPIELENMPYEVKWKNSF
ncbi:MAG: DUF2169 domain-containing protein [Patiriisocius sp.]|uniref:DUF2169 domain-containing protein n=1 Tax=Patiriisocius sp. TaxID=2822396 RepID=UPI003EF0ACDA